MSGYSGYSSYSSKVAGSGKVCGLSPAAFGGILTAAVLLIGRGVGAYVFLGGGSSDAAEVRIDGLVCATVPEVAHTTVTVDGPQPHGTRIDYTCKSGYVPSTKQSVVCGEKKEGQIVVDDIFCHEDCYELKISSQVFDTFQDAVDWCAKNFDGTLLQSTLKLKNRGYHERIKSMIGQEYPGVWIGIWKPNSGLADKNGFKFMHGSKPTIKNSNDQSQLKADDVVFRWADLFDGKRFLALQWHAGRKEHVVKDTSGYQDFFTRVGGQRAFCERMRPKCFKPKYRYVLTGRTNQGEANARCITMGGTLIEKTMYAEGQLYHKRNFVDCINF